MLNGDGQNLIVIASALFGWNPNFFIEFYGNVSKTGINCLILQMQDGERKLIIYNFFIFNRAKKVLRHLELRVFKNGENFVQILIFGAGGKKIHHLY